jgi:hypothetical protein
VDRNRILSLAWVPFLLLFLLSCQRSASSTSPLPASTIESPVPGLDVVPFPLAPASTWIYEYRAYAQEAQAVWVVTETILAVEKHQETLTAQVERIVKLQSGQPGPEFPMPPQSGTLWYILRGNNLYRQTGPLDLQKLSDSATLEMVFPPESIPCWPLNENELGPLERGAAGCRYLNSQIPAYETPAGTFDNCLELLTPYLGGGTRSVFCPKIGFVAEKFDHAGSPFGYELILIGYSLQE